MESMRFMRVWQLVAVCGTTWQCQRALRGYGREGRQSVQEGDVIVEKRTVALRSLKCLVWLECPGRSLLRKAAPLNGATEVVVTFTDYLDKENSNARRFEQLPPDTIRFVEEIERVAGAYPRR